MAKLINYAADFLWDWPLIVTILSTGIYYTLACNAFQIKNFKHICKSTLGDSEGIKRAYSLKKGKKENLTGLETFFTVIATTSGIGNITGVVTAIEIGGSGALFWMVITGILGMIIKMAEVTLAVYYRDENEDGTFESGPMQYIEKGIGIDMNFRSAKIPVFIFCIGIMSTLFINIQNYHSSRVISDVFNINIYQVAFVYAGILYYAIYKGIKKVSKAFKIIVPLIALIYIGTGLITLIRNFEMLIPALKSILINAFSLSSMIGGAAGKGISETIRQGVSRAVYSNEAGWGTTPMIHSKANTDHPVKVGFWGAIEVFFDTVICFTTGIVMVISIISGNTLTGSEGVIKAFSLGIGGYAYIVIPVMIFLFGLTTSIGWYVYYETILNYFNNRINRDISFLVTSIKYIYPVPGIITVFHVVANGYTEGLLWSCSDVLTALPTFVNVFAVLVLSNKFFDLLNDYECRYLKNSESEEIPVFFKDEDREYYNL